MPKLGSITLTGASGKTYELGVYPRADLFKHLGAVYALAKRIPHADGADYTWIYVGETADLSQRPLDAAHKACIDAQEANSLCLLIEQNEAVRQVIAADLKQAYDPPCNRE